MSDTCSTSTSLALAVVEKKPQRSGGCVGIFFQLFDWNRRLAKKKLFSKKLLPPARAKRAVKKFGGDEKLPAPKHLLIADENRGGFPNGKKTGVDGTDNSGEKTHEMRSPTLVARLMGLESIPAVKREKANKALFSELNVGNRKNTGDDGNGRGCEGFVCDEGGSGMGKGQNKIGSRPQKLQKTGLVEKRQVTRFGAEAFQFKSVLSKTRKHQPKLSSPVKSPRVGRNAARLMGAATKILEPSLQATSRAKCALSYSPSFHVNSRDEFMTQGKPFLTADDTRDANNCSTASKPLKGQPSCKSCGNWLDVVDSRSNVDEHMKGNASSTLGLGSAPPLGPRRSKVSPPESFHLQERDGVAFKSQVDRQNRSKPSSEMKHVFREYKEQYHSSDYQIKYHTDAAPSSVPNPRSRRQGQMLPKDRGNLRSKLNTMNARKEPVAIANTKNFVAVNRTSVGRTKTAMPPKVLNKGQFITERNVLDRKDGSSSRLSSPIRKKRPMTSTVPVDNASYNQITVRRQRDIHDEVIVGRCVRFDGSCKNQNRAKSEPHLGAKVDTTNVGKDIGVVSFTFSSPMRHKHNMEALSPTTAMDKTSVPGDFKSNISSPKKKLLFDTNKDKPPSRVVASHLRGDALGALLEEKLKELNCRDRDELESEGALPARSTAAILEELIVALTAERPMTVDDGDSCSTVLSQDDNMSYTSQDPSNDMTFHSPEFISDQKHEVESKVPKLFAADGEYHSPGCVLDASFSNDSCFSESLDDYTEHKAHSEYMEGFYDQPQPSEYDAELSDCATSISAVRSRIDRVIDSVDNIHSVLYSADHDILGVLENKLNNALEIIVNSDLLIGSLFDAHRYEDFPIAPLLDELEDIPDAPWTTAYCKMGFTSSKQKFLQRRFLLDCLVEFLDSTYRNYCKSRFTSHPSTELQVSVEFLAKEVHDEIQWSANLVGKSSEEMLDKEMNHSFGRWIDFDLEAFEIGEEFGSDIVQTLVDEIVIDLWQC